MDKHVLVIAATAFVAWGASTAGAQDYPDYATREQPQVVQQRQELERQLERAQSPRRSVESDNDQDDGGGMMGRGWRYHQDWGRGMIGPGMTGQGGLMDRGSMGSGMMMRMIFTLMDSDGDGSLSLDEFQTAHARIYKGMDANKDGRLTMEEMRAFLQGASRSLRPGSPRE